MLVKLTYYGTGKPTLVNLSKIETIYQVYDKYKERVSTKIQFQGGGFINVEEDLQTILKIQWDFNGGVAQDFDWQSPTIDEMVESSYEKTRKHKYSNQREVRDSFYNY